MSEDEEIVEVVGPQRTALRAESFTYTGPDAEIDRLEFEANILRQKRVESISDPRAQENVDRLIAAVEARLAALRAEGE